MEEREEGEGVAGERGRGGGKSVTFFHFPFICHHGLSMIILIIPVVPSGTDSPMKGR